MNMTQHSELVLLKMVDKYYVGVSDPSKYEEINKYYFYMHVTLHDFT